jgi:hypothetical protein
LRKVTEKWRASDDIRMLFQTETSEVSMGVTQLLKGKRSAFVGGPALASVQPLSPNQHPAPIQSELGVSVLPPLRQQLAWATRPSTPAAQVSHQQLTHSLFIRRWFFSRNQSNCVLSAESFRLVAVPWAAYTSCGNIVTEGVVAIHVQLQLVDRFWDRHNILASSKRDQTTASNLNYGRHKR